jgi:SNF2 family DNA or RNA helicase
MPLAERINDMIVVHTEYRDRELIRAVPGASYDNIKRHAWEIPLTWSGCLTLRGLFRDRLTIDPSLTEWAWRHKEVVIDPALELRGLVDGPGDERLYPFQRAGVQFLKHEVTALQSGELSFVSKLLTDDMGTGKTVQAVMTLIEYARQKVNPFPALVVCPNNMKIGWLTHFNEWWPGVKVSVLDGGRVQRLKQIKRIQDGDAHVLIANWEALRGHSRLAPFGSVALRHCIVCDKTLRGDTETEHKNRQILCEWCKRELNLIDWVTIIADEIHRAKEPTNKQTRALWALRTDKTLFRLGLTGTPVADTPLDVWPALYFIDPKAFPTRSKYADRWCLTTYNPFGGATVIGLNPATRDEYFRIVDRYVRRMPKSLVLPQLPEKVYVSRYAEMSPKQKRAYDAMRDRMITTVENDDDQVVGRLVARNVLTRLTRLSQFASSYAELVEVDETDPVSGITTKKYSVRLTEPSNKLDVLDEILDELGNKPAVVFAESRQLIELAAKRLDKANITYSKIVGGQNAYERQNSIDAFQHGRVRICLVTIKAGGIGITLTRADTGVFLQRSWSAVDNKQAEDRLHRIGSEIHKSITIIDIIAPETVEVGQRDVLEGKHQRQEEFNRDGETLERHLRGELSLEHAF